MVGCSLRSSYWRASRCRRGSARGQMPVDGATALGLSVLSALGALHDHGIVHRDLKPSNIFLTLHGIKLLDFGVARSVAVDAETALSLTSSGAMVGTPRYMAPEQVRGDAVDTRTDLFSFGVVLYEMLTGASPFDASSLPAILERILNDDAPVLGGSLAVGSIDRVIHRCLAKIPSQRYSSAAAVAGDLRSIHAQDECGQVRVMAVTRVIVLPFRLLRPDPEVDFLAFGLADAIANSLAAIDSLVVRPTLMAGRHAADAPDLEAVAEATNVDVVLHGTVLRAGTRLRVAVQLADPRAARVIWARYLRGTGRRHLPPSGRPLEANRGGRWRLHCRAVRLGHSAATCRPAPQPTSTTFGPMSWCWIRQPLTLRATCTQGRRDHRSSLPRGLGWATCIA